MGMGRFCCQDTPLANQLSWLKSGWAFAENLSAAQGERRFHLSQVRLAAARRIQQGHQEIPVVGAVQHVHFREDDVALLAEDLLGSEEASPSGEDGNTFSVAEEAYSIHLRI